MFKSAYNQSDFLDHLTEIELEKIKDQSVYTTYQDNQMIFYQGAMPFGVFILKKGKVKLYKTGSLGKNQIFQICVPGDIFGFHAAINNYQYPDSAETLEASEIQFIPKHLFIELIKNSSILSFSLIQSLSNEFRKLIDQETMLSQKNVRERTALTLHILNDIFKTDNKNSTITLSRNDLADLCGTVKETLVRTLNEFKTKNYIKSVNKRDIEITNPKALKAIYSNENNP